jgi:hypothetical protein
LTFLRVRLIVAAMTLIVSLMTALPALPTIGPPVLRLVGERLRSDTDTQQTNSGQTPDARLHAFPHCGDCWGTDCVGASLLAMNSSAMRLFKKHARHR